MAMNPHHLSTRSFKMLRVIIVVDIIGNVKHPYHPQQLVHRNQSHEATC
jgi:rRNA processing protein Gar1